MLKSAPDNGRVVSLTARAARREANVARWMLGGLAGATWTFAGAEPTAARPAVVGAKLSAEKVQPGKPLTPIIFGLEI